MRADSILDAIGHTPLVELRRLSPGPEVRLFAKLEGANPTGSMKDRIARYMVDRAEAAGELSPGQTILEPTSGNTGIALAMVARCRGYRMVAVMPDNVSPERVQLLEAFGAEVILSAGSQGSNGAIVLAQKLVRDGRYYMPYQYGNPANPLAHYETTAAEILADLPEVDAFVAGLGTGGTLMGVGRRLREHNPAVKVVAAEPHQGELVSGLRSLDDGFVPPILDAALLDGKILVHAADAFAMTKALIEQEGIFAGLSAGAAIHAALVVARRLGRGNVVALLADGGWKYLSTQVWTRDIASAERALAGKIWW